MHLTLVCSSLFKFPPSPPSPTVLPDPPPAPPPVFALSLEQHDAHLLASGDCTDDAKTSLTCAAITEQQPTLRPCNALPALPPTLAPRPCKRTVDRDEFGLSLAQRRMQLQAMAKLQPSSQKILEQSSMNLTVTDAEPSSLVARKRASRVDDFGLTAAERKIQKKALEKLQSSSQKILEQSSMNLTVTDAEPSSLVERKRASRVDDFGLTAAERKIQKKALEKLQLKAPVARSKSSTEDSSAHNGSNNDHCDFLIDADAVQCPDSQATARFSRSGSVNALSANDPHSPAKLDANTGRSDATLRIKEHIEKAVKQGASSSGCPSQTSASITPGGEKRQGSAEDSSHDRCTVYVDVHRGSRASHRNVKKSKSKNMYWPSTPQMGALCQAGCENHADAHFSCSHDFCSHCLCGIRKHQKKKKSESQKL